MSKHPYHDFYTYLDRIMGIPPEKSGPEYWNTPHYSYRPDAPTKEAPMASELGTNHPGTARLMAAIAEDVIDPRSAASPPSMTQPCRACGKWSAVGSGATPDLCFPCGDCNVRPDPYDGGCPADCVQEEARRQYLTRIDECAGNAALLRNAGHTTAADMLRDRADALTRRVG